MNTKTRMSMTDKLAALKLAGFTISYADPKDGHECGYLSWSDVHTMPQSDVDRPYVDMGSVARGEDGAGQASIVDRSNYRSLVRDYPGLFVPTSYSNVDSLGVFVADLNEDTLAVLVRLATEYPIYDEDDSSALESEEVFESWGQYLWADIDLSEQWQEVSYLFTSDEIRDAFFAVLSDESDYPLHDGTDVVWRYVDVVAHVETALSNLVWDLFGANGPDVPPLF